MHSDMKPVLDGVFTTGSSPNLLGGYCTVCERTYFPKPMVCPHCLETVQQVDLSSSGKIHSFTVVRVKAPFGLPQPYAVGYVDLEADSLRVFSLLDSDKIGRLYAGQPVTLRVAPLGVNSAGMPCLRYYFTPAEEERP